MLNIYQMKFLSGVILKDIDEKLSVVNDPEKEKELLGFKRDFEKMKSELEILELLEQLEAVKDLEEVFASKIKEES